MKLGKFIQDLNESNDFIKEWAKDSQIDNTYYFWRNEDRGYMINTESMQIENVTDINNYHLKTFNDTVIEESLDIMLSKKLDELNKLDNYDDIFEKWFIDEEDDSKYYYWKGKNKGYIAIIEDIDEKLPRIKKIESLDSDFLEPSIMKEFKDYKIKRALNNKLTEIKDENIEAKKNIFGHWLEDKDLDSTFYFWKNENEGYIALIESNPLPEIKKIEIVGNEYFEPRNLGSISNNKIKKILDKKIK